MPETWRTLAIQIFSRAFFVSLFHQVRCTKLQVPGIRNIGSRRSGGGVSVCSVTGKTSKAFGAVVVALSLFCGTMAAQQQEKSQTDIPDAPSASRPFPNAPPAGPGAAEPAPARAGAGTGPAPEPASAHQFQLDRGSGLRARGRSCSAPPFKVTTVPQGGAPAGHTAGSDELFKITVNTNQVVVPVMVKDDSGRLVNGLLSQRLLGF